MSMLPAFDEHAIRAVVTPRDAVDTIRAAFAADGRGQTVVPAVINLQVPSTHGEFHVKTAWVAGSPIVAVKVASGFYDNPTLGLPSGSGLMALFSAATGLPAALLFDNGFLTDLRTGAAGAVAADVLAPGGPVTVGVLGAGLQARYQVRCLREVRPVTRVVTWNRNRDRADAYCREVRESLGLEADCAESPEAVCRACDVLVTTTPATAPLVRADWLRAGQHVTAVGSDTPGKQELDPACLARADLLAVDRLSQCAAFGELGHAVRAGLVAESAATPLGAIVAGLRPGRTSPRQLTVCDLTGVGFQDTAIAALAWERLRAAG